MLFISNKKGPYPVSMEKSFLATFAGGGLSSSVTDFVIKVWLIIPKLSSVATSSRGQMPASNSSMSDCGR